MKHNSVMIFSFIVILFCGWWIFDYMSRDGEFVKWSHAAAGIEQFADGKVIYLGYSFMWEGIGKPEIQKLEFIKKDGSIVGEEDNELHIQPFIATTNTIGVLDEKYVLNEDLNNDFSDVNGYQVNGDFHLVLRVKGMASVKIMT